MSFTSTVIRPRRFLRAVRASYRRLKKWASNKPPIGLVRFGSLGRLDPIGVDHGAWRGKPIDRHYMERFLKDHSHDIRGRVLEIGERTYTRIFGEDRVLVSDVLHVEEGHPDATIVADLTKADAVPSDTFDCIILTQTLQFIYDMRSALGHLRRILKPGGVLLATTHGISQLDSQAMTRWGEYWRLTSRACHLLFAEIFGEGQVEVVSYGNVLSAIGLLHGLTVGELSPRQLDYHDPIYEVLIGVRAMKHVA